MPNATITVKYVNQPKPGGRKGNVKTADGQYFGVWADKLGAYQPNGVYNIEYDEETGQDGRVWKTIKSAAPNGQAPTPSPINSGYSGPRRNAGNTYRETSQRDAERMFVCSLLNAGITSGRVELTQSSLIEAVNTLRDTWDATFGVEQQQAAA